MVSFVVPARAAVLRGRVCWRRRVGGRAAHSLLGARGFFNCSGAHGLSAVARSSRRAQRALGRCC